MLSKLCFILFFLPFSIMSNAATNDTFTEKFILVKNKLSDLNQNKLNIFESAHLDKQKLHCSLSRAMDEIIDKDLLRPPSLQVVSYQQKWDLIKNGYEILNLSWASRLKLLESFRNLSVQKPSYACVQKMHEFISYSRLCEEMWIRILVHLQSLKKQDLNPLINSPPYSLLTSGQNLEIQSGDIILSYGVTATSSYASHMVFPARSFSHISFAVIENNQPAVIDFYPPGVRITPFKEWILTEQGRMAIYRYKDSKIANSAGQLALKKMRDYEIQNGKPYPFLFFSNDADAPLFCSGLIASAFRQVLGQKEFPKYRSFLYFPNADLVQKFGIKTENVFHPSDIEVDPNFYLVSETRAYESLEYLHRRDAIFKVLADRLHDGTYRTNFSLRTKFQTYFYKIKSYFSPPRLEPNPNDIDTNALESVMEIVDQALDLDAIIQDKLEKNRYQTVNLSVSDYERLLLEN